MRIQNKATIKNIRNTKYHLSILSSVVFSLCIVAITVLVVGQFNIVLTDKVVSMAYGINAQSRVNLENYTASLENTVMFMYADNDYLKFNPMDKTLSQYARQRKLTEISDYLHKICSAGEYADMMVVYNDGSAAGRKSVDTEELFEGEAFSRLNSYFNANNVRSGWLTGYGNSYNRIYYVKKLTPYSIFVVSFYTGQLGNVLYHGDASIHDFTTVIIDPNGNIIYSDEEDDIGGKITEEQTEYVFSNLNKSSVYNDEIIAAGACRNGWVLLTHADTGAILRQRNDMITYVMIISGLAILFVIGFSTWLSLRLMLPIHALIDSLYKLSTHDSLTKFLNYDNFVEQAHEKLLEKNGKNYSFVHMKINNLREINLKDGHEFGDEMVSEVAETVKNVFGRDALNGRINGAEFVSLVPVRGEYDGINNKYMENLCEKLLEGVRSRMLIRDHEREVTLLVGIAETRTYGREYSLLYDLSERALYVNSHNKGGGYHFYDYTKDYNVWKTETEI